MHLVVLVTVIVNSGGVTLELNVSVVAELVLCKFWIVFVLCNFFDERWMICNRFFGPMNNAQTSHCGSVF